jgi:hypothetical protein
MAFVNEYIPETDVKKYDLEEIDKSLFGRGRTSSRDWTIDRDRDIYLRHVASGRDEDSRISTWNFHWKGSLIWFKREILAARGARKAPSWSHIRVYDFDIPEPLQSQREVIFSEPTTSTAPRTSSRPSIAMSPSTTSNCHSPPFTPKPRWRP